MHSSDIVAMIWWASIFCVPSHPNCLTNQLPLCSCVIFADVDSCVCISQSWPMLRCSWIGNVTHNVPARAAVAFAARDEPLAIAYADDCLRMWRVYWHWWWYELVQADLAVEPARNYQCEWLWQNIQLKCHWAIENVSEIAGVGACACVRLYRWEWI